MPVSILYSLSKIKIVQENKEIAKTETKSLSIAEVASKSVAVAKKIDEVVLYVFDNNNKSGFEKAFIQSTAIEMISEMLDENYMKPIKALAGKKLGFLCDNKDYTVAVIKGCVIEATLIGLQVVGNQFNIIAGKCYVTKEGFTYLLSKVDGLYYDVTYNLPKKDGVQTFVETAINWRIDGRERTVKKSFAVAVNQGMGADAILGKAERKAKKWLYYEVTGQDISDGDTVDASATIVSDNSSRVEKQTEEIEALTEEQNRAVIFISSSSSIQELEERAKIVSDNMSGYNPEKVISETREKLSQQ